MRVWIIIHHNKSALRLCKYTPLGFIYFGKARVLAVVAKADTMTILILTLLKATLLTLTLFITLNTCDIT